MTTRIVLIAREPRGDAARGGQIPRREKTGFSPAHYGVSWSRAAAWSLTA